MSRYTVVESRRWRHTSGVTASLFGAVPWTNEADRTNWHLERAGWTVADNLRGTVGYGQLPLPTEAAAQAVADRFNARASRATSAQDGCTMPAPKVTP